MRDGATRMGIGNVLPIEQQITWNNKSLAGYGPDFMVQHISN